MRTVLAGRVTVSIRSGTVLAMAATVALSLMSPALLAADLDYATVDPELKIVRIDSAEKESFLGVRLDTTGRIFVGGREALFVYEPDDQGGYRPRQELYRFPDHTWINDIAIRGDDIYVSTVSAIYMFAGARVRRDNLRPERLVWGIPLGHVHQCLHALAWGPEGDLYCSTGDPLWYYGDFNRPDHWGHWTWYSRKPTSDPPTPDDLWQKTPYTGVGCVFRVRPDGSRFQLVATGLRNACGLCFDDRWQLFSNDNDHEALPADYVPGRLLHIAPGADFGWPRGWMPSKTPDRKDLLETMFDGMGRAVPVGQAYYNEPYLPEKYRNNLLVARWCIRAVTRYPLEPRGVSFRAREELPLLEGWDLARPVGVAVGRGGRLFVTMAYMAHNDGSPVYQSDLVMITRNDDPATHPFEPYDAVQVSPQKLFDELAQPSWDRRYSAHVEVLRRGGAVLDDARRHASRTVPNIFSPPSTPDPAGLPARARSLDSYERQLATLALADQSQFGELAAMCGSGDARTRLGGVLAAGHRLTVPKPIGEISADLPLAEPRGPEVDYAGEKIDLRKLGRIGNFTTAEWWKAAKHSAEQEQLFALLLERLKDEDESVRLQAAYFLSLLNDPRSESLVKAARALTAEQRLANAATKGVAQAWIVGPFWDGSEGFSTSHPPQKAPVDVGDRYDADGSSLRVWKKVAIQRMIQFSEQLAARDFSSYYACFQLESARPQPLHLLVGSDDGVQMWHNGQEVWKNDISRGALPFQDVVRVGLQAGSNTFLIRVHNQTGASGLYLHYKALEPLGETLPMPLGDLSARLAEAAKAEGAAKVPDDFLNIDWSQAAAGGDAANGEKLFQSIGCAKCHALKPDSASGGGPSLADAAKRFTPAYLVESVLLPSKTVSPVFRATQIATKNGLVYVGLVVGESAEQLELLLPDAQRIMLAVADIDERKFGDVSPMPAGLVKKPQELRDLLAYLLAAGS